MAENKCVDTWQEYNYNFSKALTHCLDLDGIYNPRPGERKRCKEYRDEARAVGRRLLDRCCAVRQGK